MTKESNFDVSESDFHSILDIIDRAARLDLSLNRMRASMDLSAAHNSNPLQLADLVEASPQDFIHDVYGIFDNINRETGELENLFSPRYSVK